MDFKGPKGWPQPMGPLSVLDNHSRYLIALVATAAARMADRCRSNWSKPLSNAGFRKQCRRIMEHHGGARIRRRGGLSFRCG